MGKEVVFVDIVTHVHYTSFSYFLSVMFHFLFFFLLTDAKTRMKKKSGVFS